MSEYQLPDGRIYNDQTGKITKPEKAVSVEPEKKQSAFDFPRMGGEVLGGVMGGTLAAPTANPMGILAGVGLGAEAGGQVVDLSRQYLGGQPIHGGLLDRTTDAAKNVGLNMIGEKVGGDAFNLLGRGAQALLKPVRSRMSAGNPADLLNVYKNAGVQPSAGLISGNRFIQGLEESASRMPGSQGRMGAFHEQFSNQLGNYADNVARTGNIIPMGKESTSGTLAKGAKESGKRFRENWNKLDDAVETLVGKDTPLQPDNAASLLNELESKYAANPGALKWMRKPIADLRGLVKQNLPDDAAEDAIGDVSFGALRSLRTHIGKSLEQPTVSGYVGGQGSIYRRMYGALSDDLKATANNAGPDAAKAFDVANRYANRMLKTRMPANEDIVAKADIAYKWLMSGSKDTGARLSVMRKNLTPKEWDEVAATTIEELGRANPSSQNYVGDVFSPETYLTNWNRLSEGAKKELFGGRRYSALRKEMDSLGKIVESIRNTRYMKNPSGTAQQNIFNSIWTDPVMAVSGIAMMGVPQNRIAKYFTDPRFVRWIAQGAEISPVNYNAIQAHLARIPVIAAGQAMGGEPQE